MNKFQISCILSFLFLVLFVIPPSGTAQVGEFHRVETFDGNVFTGELISENDEEIVLLTKSAGEITIRRENIRQMTRLNDQEMQNENNWHENPQSTRYLFAANALGIRKGEGYYQTTWILFNNVNYGVSNNFSIGAGMVPMFLFGVSATPFWIMPKLSIPIATDNLHISAGALMGGIIGEDSGGGGLLYGVTTLGNSDKNLSVGLGYGYGGGEISSTPLVNISGMIRTGKNIYLLSENYFVPGTDTNGIASFGLRWAPENFAVDFALVRPLEDLGGVVGIPWLGVSIPFGK